MTLCCPKCGHPKIKIYDSRITEKGMRRRRKCLACGERWSTLEISAERYERLAAIERAIENLQVKSREAD